MFETLGYRASSFKLSLARDTIVAAYEIGLMWLNQMHIEAFCFFQHILNDVLSDGFFESIFKIR